MATLLDDGDRFVLTKLDTRVLVALLRGRLNGYQVARQCEADALVTDTVNIGAVQHSLKSLIKLMLVQELEGRTDGPGRPSKLYKITSTGRQILEWQIDDMRNTLVLVEDRTKPTKKRP